MLQEEYIKYLFPKSKQDQHKPKCFGRKYILNSDPMKTSKMQRHLETKQIGALSQDIEYFKVGNLYFLNLS